jgi:hypothetical protein
MNKKSLFALSIALLIIFSASAQIKRVAILETIDRENKVPYAVRVMVRSNLTKVISLTKGYEGYERVNISAIMDEHDFERTGMVNEEQIRRLGEISGADYILVSEAVLAGESDIFVTATILNVETAKTENSDNELMGKTPHDIQHGCESLANRLMGLPDPHEQEKDFVASKKVEPEKPTKSEPEIKPAETTTVKVGKVRLGDLITFPDGTQGIVFYIGPDGKGLVVSLNEGKEPWDNSRRSEDIGMLNNFENENASMNYGEGARYTRILCSSLGDDARAAFWCRVQGEDWYLPSMGEFFVLANAFKGNPLLPSILKNYNGGEINGWYWTSSEHNRKEAWNVSDGGWISTENKREENKIRAIRAFTEQ